jgi:DNA phosphorothioation-associated DGQHR protein 1
MIQLPAIRVAQPLGEFYAVSIPAKTLLEASYAEPLRLTLDEKSSAGFGFIGGQREKKETRLKEIGNFINTTEAAFPNSIILGANYHQDGTLEEGEAKRWSIKKKDGVYELTIPSNAKLARIIDGQHRLDGFQYANPERAEMHLLCAVYLDLPLPYQAYLFATINFNQKKVDRSLAYQLFAFNVEKEPAESWSPDKLAVYLSRKLSVDAKSMLSGHIVIAAQDDEVLLNFSEGNDWKVSTATIVDGILRLYSAKPQTDRDFLHSFLLEKGRKRRVLSDDGTPLRSLYLATNDAAIYTAVLNFFSAVQNTLWNKVSKNSYIRKTVGIQALFDIMRLALKSFEQEKNISRDHFNKVLEPASHVDFSDTFFQASGIGRSRIAKALQLCAGTIERNPEMPHFAEYRRLCKF